ncbi:hypothetical protein SAMN06297251_10140 [Fulvimarina manganoxydans]|uniref:Uncharacterized protein n=1 Tax=Fulvimarina manganoxydans TaxID=937218 RepID=A0A1W1Y9I6_9HYPH|nr:hypothetical protein SAMN06297251_10140 [Fulvimarina manganoxydans]
MLRNPLFDMVAQTVSASALATPAIVVVAGVEYPTGLTGGPEDQEKDLSDISFTSSALRVSFPVADVAGEPSAHDEVRVDGKSYWIRKIRRRHELWQAELTERRPA